MSDERKRENEEEKLKDFFHNVIGIKSEAVLEVLAENSEICKLKAKTLLMKENEKVDAISFLYKKPPRLPLRKPGRFILFIGVLSDTQYLSTDI
mgnify:CR=1 FL=1